MKKTHRECVSYEACVGLRQLLKRSGVFQEEIETLCADEDPWPCRFLLGNARLLYHSVSPENAQGALEFLAGIFSNPGQVLDPSFNRETTESPFHCPELDIDMYQACSIDSCAFHTENPWTLNCILFYRLRHGRDTLNLNELAFLLKKDVGALRSQLNRTFRQLSQIALQETIERETRDERVTRINPDNVCVVCEKRTESKRRIITKADFSYCSTECANYKPPQVIRLEHKFSLSIERVLELCVARFSSVKNMCSALGVGPTLFEGWCEKYGTEIPGNKRK